LHKNRTHRARVESLHRTGGLYTGNAGGSIRERSGPPSGKEDARPTDNSYKKIVSLCAGGRYHVRVRASVQFASLPLRRGRMSAPRTEPGRETRKIPCPLDRNPLLP